MSSRSLANVPLRGFKVQTLTTGPDHGQPRIMRGAPGEAPYNAALMSLTVILITRNEAEHIGPCLASVDFADEWVVVDNGSTDGTPDIARRLGARVIDAPDWPGFGPQKNRALDAARSDWVFSIDADERI